MSGEENANSLPPADPVKPAVFSPTIDRLIKEIWELGGMEELRSNIDRLKQMPQADFEARLREMRDRLTAIR